MAYKRKVNTFDDEIEVYTEKELIQMYLDEGKTEEDAKVLAKELSKFMNRDASREHHSYQKSYWERAKVDSQGEPKRKPPAE